MASNIVLIVEPDEERTKRYIANVQAHGSGYMTALTPEEAIKTLQIAPAISELCIAGLYYRKGAGIEHLRELIADKTGTG